MHRNCNPCPTPLSSYTKTFKLRSLQLLTTTTYTFPKDLVEWGTTFRKYKTAAEQIPDTNHVAAAAAAKNFITGIMAGSTHASRGCNNPFIKPSL